MLDVSLEELDASGGGGGEGLARPGGICGHLESAPDPQVPPQPYPGQPPRYEYLENSKGMAIGYTAILSDHVTNVFRYG